MSATFETTSTLWGKRHREEDSTPTHMDRKRLRYYYYRLESESSKASEEDTESVYSLQGKETDVVRDSSDTETDTNLEESEYEIVSLSENEIWDEHSNSSSGSEDMTLGRLVAAAQAMYDSSMEKWNTDCEESDNSSLDDSGTLRSDFSTCTQCKSVNVNPQYRYCEKCYQDRKKFFPPRPRGNRKTRNTKKKSEHVKLENLQTALQVLSQDSGIGSSQEMQFSSVSSEESLKTGTSDKPSSSSTCSTSRMTRKRSTELAKSTSSGFSSSDLEYLKNNRKRYLSESSLSDFEIKKPKLDEKAVSQTSDVDSGISTASSEKEKLVVVKDNELAIETESSTKSPETVGF